MRNYTILIKPASSLCNMKCEYCFYEDVSNNRKIKSYGLMQEETLEKIIASSLEYNRGSLNFVFQGGEPTLVGIDFYKKVIEFQKKHNNHFVKIYNSIQTNGYSLDEEFIIFLKENNFLVGISYDGINEIHDKYRIDKDNNPTSNQIQKTISLLTKHQVEFNILCVVTQEIMDNVESVFENLKKYKYLQFVPKISDFNSTNQALDNVEYGNFLIKLFKLYAKQILNNEYISIRDFDNYIVSILGYQNYSCSAIGRCGGYVVFEANGNAYPCDFYMLDQYYLGNINEQSIDKLIRSEVNHEFNKESLILNKECFNCQYHRLCNGGCRRLRKEPRGISFYCEAYKLFFSECLEDMKKLSLLIQ